MTQEEKLLEAWDQLVNTIAQKTGLSNDQAIKHVKKHFPELYDLYKKAKKQQEAEVSSQ
jgi:uncharacterized protein YidB (DUF937 family)